MLIWQRDSCVLSTVAAGDEIQDLLHFKNDGQLRTLNRCHSLPQIRNRSPTNARTHTQSCIHWKSTPGQTHHSHSVPRQCTSSNVECYLMEWMYVCCWFQQLQTWYSEDQLDWNNSHKAIIRWACLQQLNILSGEVDRVLLESTKQLTTRYACLSVGAQEGPVLKPICLSLLCRHIISLFWGNIHFLPFSLSPTTAANQFIHPTSVCLDLVSDLQHYCPDAKVSGQGDKLEHTHTYTHFQSLKWS